MRINWIECNHVRNLASIRADFSRRFNFLIGGNAQGKSNLLEAVYLLSELRSFRGASLQDMVRQGEKEAAIKAEAIAGGLEYEIDLRFRPGSVQLRVNGKSVRLRKNFLGTLPMVIFAPDDISLSKGSPSGRRKFMDRALFLLDTSHWEDCCDYQKLLRNRNSLLKQGNHKDPLFEVYSLQLATIGERIVERRLWLVDQVGKKVTSSIRRISSDVDDVSLSYRYGGLCSKDEGEEALPLSDRLASNLAKDLRKGWTGVGPHSDDLEIFLDSNRALHRASQGQHRSIALLLKIAELEAIRMAREDEPLLLIDDLSSELDEYRRCRLVDFLMEGNGQVILTSTDVGNLKGFPESSCLFDICEGRISCGENGSGLLGGD